MTIGIIGSGMIVAEMLAMLRDELPQIQPNAIYAHSNVDQARQLAEAYGIPNLYTDYDTMLSEDDSDCLYIANVNTAHYEYALAALHAGRSVIIEKPICMTYVQTLQLITLARTKGLFLIEAVSMLHMPNMAQLRRMTASLGHVSIVNCDYSQYSSRYDRYLEGDIAPVFDPKMGGGALHDLNVYNINFVISLFGEPLKIDYKANIGHNGIDTSGILYMQYDGFQCVCSASKDSYGSPRATIQGDRGIIVVDGPVSILSKFKATLRAEDGTLSTTEYAENTFRHRLAHEFAAFEKMLSSGDTKTMEYFQNISLSVMKCIRDATFKIR